MIDGLNDTELFALVKAILKKVVYKSTSLATFTPDTRLQEDLDLDSARLVDMVLNLEDEFGIHIEDESIEHIKTVGDLTNLIREKTGA